MVPAAFREGTVTPLIALVVVAGLGLVMAGWSGHQRRRKARRAIERLREGWGRPREGDRPGGAPGFYYGRQPASSGALDEMTWADLNMDAVFAFLDRTTCVLGSEVLYDRLRRQRRDEEDLARFDGVANRLAQDERARLDLQVELARITETYPAIAWQIALESLPPLPAWLCWISPGVAVFVSATIAATIAHPAFISLVVPALLLAFVARAFIARRIAPWVSPFLAVGQIIEAARRVADLEPADEPTTRVIAERLPGLRRLARLARWLGQDPSRTDLSSLIAEYFNLFFCVDGNVLLVAFGLADRHRRELCEVAEALGRLDAAIAVASVRAGGTDWTRPAFAGPTDPARFTGLRHPLVRDCVSNTVVLGPVDGVILTGANMTGKSTFLRSLGTNVVLAQSIFTVFADAYDAPWMTVRTSISPTDELLEGKSLYQKEAETVVSVVAQAERPGVLLCLFDELFRGTNSVDRISATAAVCSYLVGPEMNEPRSERRGRSLVVVATHDLDLVPHLAGGYAAFHFGDRIDANRLVFDYRLRPGVASSRNAIALLQILGAPHTVVVRANERAAAMG
jgi:MutS domain V